MFIPAVSSSDRHQAPTMLMVLCKQPLLWSLPYPRTHLYTFRPSQYNFESNQHKKVQKSSILWEVLFSSWYIFPAIW